MIYTYNELKDSGLDAYNINKKVIEKELYKLERGLYSDKEEYNSLEYIVKKYPNYIFTLESAFFYWGLTKHKPNRFILATKHNAKKINDEKVKQIFVSNYFFEMGLTQLCYDNVEISIYNKERMLIELIRNKNFIAIDYYNEIMRNYKKIFEELDKNLLMDYLKGFINNKSVVETLKNDFKCDFVV